LRRHSDKGSGGNEVRPVDAGDGNSFAFSSTVDTPLHCLHCREHVERVRLKEQSRIPFAQNPDFGVWPRWAARRSGNHAAKDECPMIIAAVKLAIEDHFDQGIGLVIG
jgi:hypothetical protein